MSKRVIITVDIERDPPLDYVKERMAEAFKGWNVLQLQVQETIAAPTADRRGKDSLFDLANRATESRYEDT